MASNATLMSANIDGEDDGAAVRISVIVLGCALALILILNVAKSMAAKDDVASNGTRSTGSANGAPAVSEDSRLSAGNPRFSSL